MLVFSDLFVEATSLGGLDKIQKGSIFSKLINIFKKNNKQSTNKNKKDIKDMIKQGQENIDPGDILDLGMMYSLRGKK